MEKYEIRIGEFFDLNSCSKKPKTKIIISKEQFDVIELFADKRKDSELNTIYKINDCEFMVIPTFDFNNENNRSDHK